MHEDEVDIDADLVGRLVTTQFPQLADLPISAFRSTGTVNAIYRIGDRLYARLPRMHIWAQDLDREWHWLPQLAPHLSLRVPEPVGKGHPTSSYPFACAIYGWIDGQPYADELVDDERQAARDLAQFVVELRTMDLAVGAPPVKAPPVEAPRTGRKPLRQLDAVTREAIESARASSTAMRPPPPGSAPSTGRRGRERRCGYTPTCSGQTFSFTTVGSPPSSTSAGSGSVIQPLM